MKTIKKYIILILILSSFILNSCRAPVKGRVSVKGNEPNTYTALITEKYGHLRIKGKLSKEIKQNCQGKIIEALGEIKIIKGPGEYSTIIIEEYSCGNLIP